MIDRRVQMDIAATPKRILNARSAAIFVAAAMMGAASACADDSVNTGYFGGIAIMGYDTVAYFTDGRAVKGSEEFSYEWLGIPWHFSSKEHQDMFMRAPVKYAPQYGGYCADGVAGSGSATVNVDPEAFKIIDGKLYLIYDPGNANAFAADAKVRVPKADANWPKAKAELELDQYH
jgi:YHS domain-containing protein